MEGQNHIYGDRLTLLVGQTLRTAHQRIDPVGTRHIVVLVVVEILFGGIYILLKARPLQPITGTLAEAGILARGGLVDYILLLEFRACRACHIAIAATNLHSIGRDGLPLTLALVCKRYEALLVALVEGEVAEIYPHTSTHLLIDGKAALATRVVYGVGGIRRALVAAALIRYIYRIAARFGDCGVPLRETFIT